jgi:hypothetical protein
MTNDVKLPKGFATAIQPALDAGYVPVLSYGPEIIGIELRHPKLKSIHVWGTHSVDVVMDAGAVDFKGDDAVAQALAHVKSLLATAD